MEETKDIYTVRDVLTVLKCSEDQRRQITRGIAEYATARGIEFDRGGLYNQAEIPAEEFPFLVDTLRVSLATDLSVKTLMRLRNAHSSDLLAYLGAPVPPPASSRQDLLEEAVGYLRRLHPDLLLPSPDSQRAWEQPGETPESAGVTPGTSNVDG